MGTLPLHDFRQTIERGTAVLIALLLAPVLIVIFAPVWLLGKLASFIVPESWW